jgi:predicted MarR family transcription regulator
MSNVNDGRRIPAPDLQEDDKRLLEFSFKYLDSTNEKFSPQECSVEFFRALIEAIQAYSHWTVERFTDQNNKDHRHIIVLRKPRNLMVSQPSKRTNWHITMRGSLGLAKPRYGEFTAY